MRVVLPLSLAGRLSIGAVALGAGVVMGAGLVWGGPVPDRTAAGTTIGGLPASGLRADAVEALLRNASSGPPAVRITAGARRLNVPRGEIGLELDVEATARNALDASRRPLLRGDRSPPRVRPVLREVAGTYDALSDRLVALAAIEESHGSIVTTGRALSSVAPRDGQRTTAEAVRGALREAASRLPFPSTVQIPVEPVGAHVTAEQVDVALRTAQEGLLSDLSLTAGPRRATVDARLLRRSLILVPTETSSPHGVEVAVDGTDSTGLLGQLSAQLSVSPVEPRLLAPEPQVVLTDKGTTSWTPTPASVTVVAPGMPGQLVSATEVRAALDARLQGQPAPMDIRPVRVAQRNSDAAARQVDAALGTFTTPFTCCPPRVTNIRVMALALDGLLLAPGQQFSLNGIIGRRTAAKGYVDAPFILDGELSTDTGGGVSQVATTLLNAAFFAGLRLDQHQAHSFYISRYPPGREATVNFPGIDLRFTNDTIHPVLLRTRVSRSSVTVALYGHGDGRRIDGVTSPRRALSGRDFAVTVTRTVTIEGTSRRTSFRTSYNEAPEEP